ncbi:MAG: DUF2202 domain-containing protein [Bacteroidales bacterium]|nr:DUF2202 domain-containing protein [Bacteroidales bacterium]
MKTIVKCRTVSVAIFLLLVGLGACENEQMNTENDDYVSILKVAGDGTTSVIESNLLSVLTETPAISGEEMSALLEMKEEEKLARDVYTFLYAKWGNQIFYNISLAEERHMNAVILLLKFYDSPDTLVGEAGVFTKQEFQTLYNDLTTAGSVSVEKAYETGAMIEEMDIKDLSETLDVVTNSNIILVFENLLKGSRNHLRAFIRQLTNLGIIYTPVYISEEEFQEIITSPMETGNQYRMNRYGRQGRHGNNGGQNGLNGNGRGH